MFAEYLYRKLHRNRSLSTLLSGPPPKDMLDCWLNLKLDSTAMLTRSFDNKRCTPKPPIPYRQNDPGEPTGLRFMVLFDEEEFACRQNEGTGFRVINSA